MPKVTEAHVEARRRQVLDASASCFASQGFHQTTMQDICRAAQLSPGAVYSYFASKEEIIRALGKESQQRNLALIAAVKGRDNLQQVVNELADHFFTNLDSSDPLACACMRLDIELWAEALRSPNIMEHLRQGLDSHREPFAEIIRRAQQRGEVNPNLDPDAVARIMVSLFTGALLQKAIDPTVNVWKYVAAAKAMMTGAFWTGESGKQ